MSDVFVYGGDDYPFTGTRPYNVFRGNTVIGTAAYEGGQFVVYDTNGTPQSSGDRNSLNDLAETSLE